MSLLLENRLEEQVSRILLEYVQVEANQLPFGSSLSLRNDLAIDSLSLVSVVLKLGDECEVDVVDSGFDLTALLTVGDLVNLARALNFEPRSIA